MELTGLAKKITKRIGKYKYALLILLLGLTFMLIPGKRNNATVSQPEPTVQAETDYGSGSLEEILSQISGAGKVRVLLSVASGEKTVYQADSDITSDSSKTDTVIITDENRAQAGLIQQVDPPVYLGAIVVCQGADSPKVRLWLVEAVSKYTGLGADKISVLKMK